MDSGYHGVETDVIGNVFTDNTAAASNFGMVVGGREFHDTTAGATNVFVSEQHCVR